MPIVKRWLVRPLLEEDGVAVEAEQAGYEAHFDRPVPDLNPVVHAFQELTVRKWEEHLAGRGNTTTVPSHDARYGRPGE
jgi:4beta-methylsterol monooxygenase